MTPAERLEFILALLAIVLVLEVMARRIHLPPAAVLVLGGIALAFTPGVPDIRLDPSLILLLFLPPLLFSSAVFTVWRDFRDNLRIILQLAVGAVVFTALVIGVVAHLVLPALPWAACFALGAIVSPPDAVAAKAVLKGLPLPPRLTTLLEGESLVNDATGLVLFRLAIVAGLTGSFSAWDGVGTFGLLTIGGIGIGVAFGHGAAALLTRIKDPTLNIVGGLLVAWGAYIAGDLVHVSGVLSTVACGLILGWRQHHFLPAAVRTQGRAVWNIIVFLLESLIFILIGLSLRGVLDRLNGSSQPLWSLAIPVAAIAAAMILARFAWIMPAVYLPRFLIPALRRRDPYPPWAVPVVMSWAGMRGVVSLGAALSVPEAFPGRDIILAITLAVILISILLQGTTLAPLIRMLELRGFAIDAPNTLTEDETRILLSKVALDAIRERSSTEGGPERHPRLLEQYAYRAEMIERFARQAENLMQSRQDHFETVLDANRASRAKLLELHRKSQIHDRVLKIIEAELDLEELGIQQALTRTEGEGA